MIWNYVITSLEACRSELIKYLWEIPDRYSFPLIFLCFRGYNHFHVGKIKMPISWWQVWTSAIARDGCPLS
jgi:hypothetical protein